MVVAYKLLINIHFLARQGFSAMRRLVHRLSRRFGKLTGPTWRIVTSVGYCRFRASNVKTCGSNAKNTPVLSSPCTMRNVKGRGFN
jgi:hypothetical protein